MKSIKQVASAAVLKEVYNYLEKDPINNIPKIIDLAEKLNTKEENKKTIQLFREITSDPNNSWNKFIHRALNELNPNVKYKFIVNYLINAGVIGAPQMDKMKQKYDCNIPWAILMDPTAACNLNCTGCWAQEYKKTDSMSYELLDRIINEGKDLGIFVYIYSGGEPLLRKKDLIKLAEKHDDCAFLSFTNGTLVDEEFADELARVGNLILAFSVEGFEEETDMRRGKGTFKKVMHAMDLLKERGVGFGFSTCYHNKNVEVVASDEYVDMLIEKGCMLGWYFTYIPLGKDAVMDLLVTPEQRKHMYYRIREMRETKPIFTIDFWNDGEYINGCIAGGRHYLHITANGDVEPCAFIHYSNVNIKDVSLIEALKSPLFMEYRKNQPFNENHLRPCPLLDNPDKLKAMVHNSKAVSTQYLDLEDVDTLTDKCQDISKRWAVVADELWEQSQKAKAEMQEVKK